MTTPPTEDRDWTDRVVKTLRLMGVDDHIPAIVRIVEHEITTAEARTKEKIKEAVMILPTLYGMPEPTITREDVLIVIDDPLKAKDL